MNAIHQYQKGILQQPNHLFCIAIFAALIFTDFANTFPVWAKLSLLFLNSITFAGVAVVAKRSGDRVTKMLSGGFSIWYLFSVAFALTWLVFQPPS